MGVKHVIAHLFLLNIFSKGIKTVPKNGGYNKACDKIPPAVIDELLHKSHDLEHCSSGEKYHAMKVIIVDGTKIIIPRTKETIKKYGLGSGSVGNAYYPQTQTSGFFELSTGTFEDVKFKHINTPERRIMLEHAETNNNPTLYVIDAGYNGMGFIAIIKTACTQNILMHLKLGGFIADKFRKSKKRSEIIEIEINSGHLQKYPEYKHLRGRKIKVRLIRTRGTTKLKSQILITTLLDEKQYKWEELSKLYLQRYKVELAFRHLKIKIGIEKIKKEKLLRIEQLLRSAVLLFNISAMLRNSVKRRTLMPEKKGEKIYCLEFCTEIVNNFISGVIKNYKGLKTKLKLCIKALKSCYSICRPWRVFPRICQFPASTFTRQKTSRKNSELEKVEFLAREYKKLGVKYGML